MIDYRPHEMKPDKRRFYVYDLNYNFISECTGIKKVQDIIGVEINDYQVSSNSKKIKVLGKYYITKESFFTEQII